LIMRCFERGNQRYLLAGLRDERDWRFEVCGRSEQSDNRRVFKIIERRQNGEAVGYLGHRPWLQGNTLSAAYYELLAGVSWYDVTPSVLRHLWLVGQEYARAAGTVCETVGMMLGEEHPAYRVAAQALPRRKDSYAWFMRIADIPAFLRTIAPVLEQRLAASDFAGQTARVTLDFYRSALLMDFVCGKLAGVETIPSSLERSDWAGFPGLTFLQLLLGYRTVEEIEHLFADCFTNSQVPTRELLNTLFPKKTSNIWPVY
jgi:hypothetical protein